MLPRGLPASPRRALARFGFVFTECLGTRRTNRIVVRRHEGKCSLL